MNGPIVISDEVVEVAAKAEFENRFGREGEWSLAPFAMQQHVRATVRVGLTAAAPLIAAQALEGLTRFSPRLPGAVRNEVFEILHDFMDKFDLVSRHKGPTRHISAPGYEWGDMCGYMEIRLVALLRASTVAPTLLDIIPEHDETVCSNASDSVCRECVESA